MLSRRKLIKAGAAALAAPAIMKYWPALIEECKAAITAGGVTASGTPWPEVPTLNQILGPGGSGTTQTPNLFLMYNGTPAGNLFGAGASPNNTPITTKAQWWQHRAEMRAALLYYCKGRIPPPSPVVLTSQLADVSITNSGGSYVQRTFNLATGPDPANRVPFFINMYLNPSNTSTPYGSGPYPCILSPNGSSGSSVGSALVAGGNGPGPVALAQLINMGYIFAEFGKDTFCPDQGDLAPLSDEAIYTHAPSGVNSILGTTQTGTKPIFALYPFDRTSGTVPNSGAGIPDLTNASMNFQKGIGGFTGYDWSRDAAWLWGAMRCIDFLFTLPYIDKGKLAACGVSRNNMFGNWLPALDERVTVGLPNQGTYYDSARYQENVGTLGWYNQFNYDPTQVNGYPGPVQGCQTSGCPLQASAGQFWPMFNVRCAQWWPGRASTGKPGTGPIAVYGGRLTNTAEVYPAGTDFTKTVWTSAGTIPFEEATIIACIAPRYMMSTESLGWVDSCCCGVAQACVCAATVWAALGVPNRIWVRYTDVADSNNNQHWMTTTHWQAMVAFCEYVFRGVALPATSTTVGSQSIWCNASTPGATNIAGTVGNSRGFPATAPIYAGLGNDNNPSYGWTPPGTLT